MAAERILAGNAAMVLERGRGEVERRGQVAGLERGERGAEAVEREGEVVGARVRVGGGGRVRGDGRAEEGGGGRGLPWWRGGQEDE